MKKFCTLALMFLIAGPLAWAVRTVTDETGRRVALPDKVARVICLTPSLVDTVYALGGGPQLVAITDYTLYPAQAAREKPSIGDILNPSLERILSLHPDVVIAVSTLNSPETVRGLERLKIPVFLVHGRGLAGVYSTITSVGRVLGRDREAGELSKELKAREERIRRSAYGKKRPAVFLAVQLEPCITAGRGAFITELIEAAGARSVTSDVQQDWLRISLEAVIPRNPDYVLIMKTAVFGLKDMRARAGWSALRAVQEGRIMYADDRLQIPGPVAFDGLEDLAKQIQAAQ